MTVYFSILTVLWLWYNGPREGARWHVYAAWAVLGLGLMAADVIMAVR